jgi:hypothetical protein
VQYRNHFPGQSAAYNNMLSIATSVVENGGRQRGYEQIRGDACVTLNGRVSSSIWSNSATNLGGLRYFTHDGSEPEATGAALDGHIDKMNANYKRTKALDYQPKVIPELVKGE